MKSRNSSLAPARTKEMQRRLLLPAGKEKAQKTQQRLFNNRWSTLKRKAKHLASLCNGQVCMIMSSGSNGNNVEVWPKNPGKPAAAGATMMKYLEAQSRRSFTRKKLELNLLDFPEIQQKEAVNTRKGFRNDYKEFAKYNEESDKFSRESLIDLSVFLKSKVEKLDKTIRSIEIEVSSPTFLNYHQQTNGCSFGQNNNNSFSQWGLSDCQNNPCTAIYGTTTPNFGQSSSMGLEAAVENTLYQQGICGFGEKHLVSHHQ